MEDGGWKMSVCVAAQRFDFKIVATGDPKTS
jgi:hypothetical protein